MNRGWTTAAVVAPLALLVYLLLLDFVDLFPWNDLSVVTVREQVLGILINDLIILLIAAAFMQSRRVLQFLAVLASALFVLGHIVTWWIPYFFGTSSAAMQEHAYLYGRTTTFLPPIQDHPRPNAAHVVVGVLALATLICTTMAIIVTREQKTTHSPVSYDWS